MTVDERNKQDHYLKSQLSRLVLSAADRGYPQFSSFLEERQQNFAWEILRHYKYQNYLLFGGAENCERVVLGVFPEYMDADSCAFPIVSLKFSYSGKEALTHRDYLGALMALQIKREMLGDIWVQEKGAVLFVLEPMADFIRMNLNQIGRASIQIADAGLDDLNRLITYKEITGTVSSLRLDCITALVCGKSRSLAAELIAAGLVKVNGIECLSASKTLHYGDSLAIRKYGKFILDTEGKRTKKDRLFLTIKQLQ